MNNPPFNSALSKSIRRSLKRPVSAILGWGVCGFGITAWILFLAHSVVFNPDLNRSEKVVQATSGVIAWIIAGALFGTIIFLTNRRQKDWGETATAAAKEQKK
jgi:hypothetical protein